VLRPNLNKYVVTWVYVSFLDCFFPNLGKFINVLAPGGGGDYFPHLPDDKKLVIWKLLNNNCGE
jgi:hypothetical protein